LLEEAYKVTRWIILAGETGFVLLSNSSSFFCLGKWASPHISPGRTGLTGKSARRIVV
jgi:hypothetical protein